MSTGSLTLAGAVFFGVAATQGVPDEVAPAATSQISEEDGQSSDEI